MQLKFEKNGRKSSEQKTRHMDIRYCWIADRLKSENVSIGYCPTLKTLADFFTKPLHASLFQKFRDYILGYENIEQLQRDSEESVEQECVKKMENRRFVPPIFCLNLAIKEKLRGQT